MAVVSLERLSTEMRTFAPRLINQVGLVLQARDRPIEAGDLLFYLTQTSKPMADFMRKRGLFMDGAGLHFDVAQFGAIRELAEEVIAEHEAGNSGTVWQQLDLATDEDADYNGGYILTALAALELMNGKQ